MCIRDRVDSYGRTVGGSVSTEFGADSGVFDMPEPLIRFLDEQEE